jgi:hypothetical protein
MKQVNAILGASGLALALYLPSWAQEVKQLPTQTITRSGTVETIDHAKHVMNIKTADGKFETTDVPESAKRFDELKVGDKVSVTYNNTVSARLKPPGEAPVDAGSMTSTMGQEARPGGTAAVYRIMTATINGAEPLAVCRRGVRTNFALFDSGRAPISPPLEPEEAGGLLKPGSMWVYPKRHAHYAWTGDGEAVLPVQYIGPGGIEYVNAADDPRKTR